VTELVTDLDDSLFTTVVANDQHVLHCTLPDHYNHSYNLRDRRHDLVLATKRDSGNFIKDSYLKTCTDLPNVRLRSVNS